MKDAIFSPSGYPPKKYGEPPKVFWKYYDLYRRKQITLNDYVVKTGLELPAICYYLDAVAEKNGNVNSKCEKNIKKYNQASRANSSRHSANTISEVFQPNISRG